MIIVMDTREHAKEQNRIKAQLEAQGHTVISHALPVGDYVSLHLPRLVIDRKKTLQELCINVDSKDHERFREELIRAKKLDLRLLILIEDGSVRSLEDVKNWQNSRLKDSPKATTGEQLYKALMTMKEKYDVRFAFTDQEHCGQKIAELLTTGERLQRENIIRNAG